MYHFILLERRTYTTKKFVNLCKLRLNLSLFYSHLRSQSYILSPSFGRLQKPSENFSEALPLQHHFFIILPPENKLPQLPSLYPWSSSLLPARTAFEVLSKATSHETSSSASLSKSWKFLINYKNISSVNFCYSNVKSVAFNFFFARGCKGFF